VPGTFPEREVDPAAMHDLTEPTSVITLYPLVHISSRKGNLMATTLRSRIIKIGNSQGIRIPKLLLEQAHLGQEVEMELQEDQIVVRSPRQTRHGWEEQFRAMAELGDDALLDPQTSSSTTWDEAEWQW
jgi:antitoxin MazE